MSKRVTIFEPPPLDPSKAAIENVLDLTPISDIGPVRRFFFREAGKSLIKYTGRLHKHPTAMASPRRARHLRRRRDRAMPVSRTTNRP